MIKIGKNRFAPLKMEEISYKQYAKMLRFYWSGTQQPFSQ